MKLLQEPRATHREQSIEPALSSLSDANIFPQHTRKGNENLAESCSTGINGAFSYFTM